MFYHFPLSSVFFYIWFLCVSSLKCCLSTNKNNRYMAALWFGNVYFLCFTTCVSEISPRAAWCNVCTSTKVQLTPQSRIAQVFSKPGNFASTLMTIRIEKSLKNSVFVLIPVFLSDSLSYTASLELPKQLWWISDVCLLLLHLLIRSIPGCKGTDYIAKNSIKTEVWGVHALLTAEQGISGNPWFPQPVELMLPRYLSLSMDCVLVNNQRENSSPWLSRGGFVTKFECCFLLKCFFISDVHPAGK